MWHCGIGLLLCALISDASAEPLSQRRPIDLELILAVDNSLSVNTREFDLQISGIAKAFEDPDVIGAILSHQGIAVALVLWSNHEQQETGVGWSYLHDAESIAAFAAKVANVARIDVSGGTGLGSAMAYALRLFGTNAFDGKRRVIDVSGDGQNNMGVEPRAVRDRAVALGLTVNGLAILDEEPRLDGYYAANVIGGPGAFLEIAEDFDSFAAAIRRKLVREIAGRSLVYRLDSSLNRDERRGE
ncbi:MAG: DUF1194 domain-containing protein [Alphaproteobacteria bacterium]|nr:DUF1194 domain-containing protein [Alphaproteobacteria bacterium]